MTALLGGEPSLLKYIAASFVPPDPRISKGADGEVILIPNAVPSKFKFASPFKLVPLPPVITLLSALFDNVADPAAP